MSELEQRLATRRSECRGWAVQEGGVLNEKESGSSRPQGMNGILNPGGQQADPLVMVEAMKKNMTMVVRAPGGCSAGRCW
jgi:hypothetical protein